MHGGLLKITHTVSLKPECIWSIFYVAQRCCMFYNVWGNIMSIEVITFFLWINLEHWSQSYAMQIADIWLNLILLEYPVKSISCCRINFNWGINRWSSDLKVSTLDIEIKCSTLDIEIKCSQQYSTQMLWPQTIFFFFFSWNF